MTATAHPITPFQAPHRLRLNLAIGGNAGNPSKTRLSQSYEVDFVRIYQKRPDAR